LRKFLPLLALLGVAVVASCGRGGTGTVRGSVEAQGGVIPGATVEAYLKPGVGTGEKPLLVTATDENGRFSLALPRGTYYLAARAENPGGGPRLMGAPEGPIVVSQGGETVTVVIRVKAKGEEGEVAESVRLTGRILRDGSPAAGVSISTYPPEHPSFSGPGHLASGVSGEDGRFSLLVPVRKQGVTARLRIGQVRVGVLSAGDLSSGDPLPVDPVHGTALDVGDIPIHPLRQDRLESRKEEVAGVAISGVVKDGEGRLLAGLYAMAYRNPDMTAKPTAISRPTGADGRFRLSVPGPGTYYLGVRSHPGGPVQPGETMGSYQETPDHSLAVGATPITGLELTAERML
jgi:hypothetical protein